MDQLQSIWRQANYGKGFESHTEDQKQKLNQEI